MTSEADERLQNELALLESIYPDEVKYNAQARDVNYRSALGGFTLRLPNEYLVSALPDVVAASAGQRDVRERLKKAVKECSVGEEVLDSIILVFNDLADSANASASEQQRTQSRGGSDAKQAEGKATVVVWLHHLLNTNKRKQALSPPSSTVSGITKPGYPGVLVYSGPFNAVHEHVNELKSLNWQAFQVRLETEEQWTFAHGTGVKEVEAMKEVVAEVGEERKAVFMEAMRMK